MNNLSEIANLYFGVGEFDLKEMVDEVGLLRGYSGIAIVYYLLSKKTGNKDFENRGQYYLEWISENGATRNDLHFANGLSGIGWTIEWLVQTNLMGDTNTDEILEPVDDILYQSVSYSKEKEWRLFDGILGKVIYFLRRAMSQNEEASRFKTISHKECVVLLVDDLYEAFIQGTLASMKSQQCDSANESFQLSELGQLLTIISSIKIKANTPTIGHILFDAIKYCELELTKRLEIEAHNHKFCERSHLETLYLAICYLIAAKKQNNRYWEEKAIDYIKKLLPFSDREILVDIDTHFARLSVYSLLNYYFPNAEYSKMINDLIATISNSNLPLGIYKGRGALIVAEVCLRNPELITDWHEIIFF